jgi:hypothetical protein
MEHCIVVYHTCLQVTCVSDMRNISEMIILFNENQAAGINNLTLKQRHKFKT